MSWLSAGPSAAGAAAAAARARAQEQPTFDSWLFLIWHHLSHSQLYHACQAHLSHAQTRWPVWEPLIIDLLAVVVGLWVGWKVSRPLKRYFDERPMPVRLQVPLAARPGYSGPLLDELSISSKEKPGLIQCYDPATGYHLGDIAADDAASIDAKVQRAQAAQLKWRNSSWGTRRKLMNTVQKWVVDECENITRVAARDTGKTAIDAAFGELLTTCSKAAWISKNGEQVLRDEVRPNNLLLAHKVCKVVHEPMGVVCACVSWNYPAHNVLGPILSALFAGNAIVVKGSELVVWSSSYFVLGLRACLLACGLDAELVQLVTCFPEHADVLTTHPSIAHITFIGSEPVGRKVAQAATRELTPVTLELGGKDAAIVLADADLAYFQSTFMRGTFQAVGQNCIGIERWVVADSNVDKLLDLVEPRVRRLRCGSFLDDTPFGRAPPLVPKGGTPLGRRQPTPEVVRAADVAERRSVESTSAQVDCGAMISDARFAHLEGLIEDAVKRGAKLLVGGKRLSHPKWPKGHYFQPTLITDVTVDMPIAQEELFAPVMLIMPFRANDISHAVSIANSTRYGLGSSIFGSTRSVCLDVAKQLHTGTVNINDFGVAYLNQGLPFGGVKKSGYGRFAGPEGLLAMTNPKVVTSDWLFGLVRTGIPKPLDYPLQDAQRSWGFLQGLIRFAYGDNDQAFQGIGALIYHSIFRST